MTRAFLVTLWWLPPTGPAAGRTATGTFLARASKPRTAAGLVARRLVRNAGWQRGCVRLRVTEVPADAAPGLKWPLHDNGDLWFQADLTAGQVGPAEPIERRNTWVAGNDDGDDWHETTRRGVPRTRA
jgi:hypothetical protein